MKSLNIDLMLCGQSWAGTIEREVYTAGSRTALEFIDSHGESIATLTFNPDQSETLGENEVVIKDYSENEGVFAQLVEAGVVRDTGRRVRSGHITAPIAEIVAPELV
jgi:hypothetical protein